MAERTSQHGFGGRRCSDVLDPLRGSPYFNSVPEPSPDAAAPSPLRVKIAAARRAATELEQCTDQHERRPLAEARRASHEAVVEQVRGLLVRGLRRLGVSPADAEDHAQQRVLKIVSRLMECDDNPDAYVARCVRTIAVDIYRQAKRERGHLSIDDLAGDHTGELADPGSRPDERYDEKRLAGALPEIIDALPPRERYAFIAIHVHGRTREDLAQEDLDEHPHADDGRKRTFEEARGAVYQRLSRALNRVRGELRRRFGDGTPQ